MAHGNGGKRHDASLPYDAKRVPALGDGGRPPSDRRLETAEDDRECLPTIPVMPGFDRPETAVKKGGRNGV